MCKGHVLKICECKNRQSRICDGVCDKIVKLFDLIRSSNRDETDTFEYISQFVSETVFKLAQFKDQLVVALNRETYVEEDVSMILDTVKILYNYYVTYGCHDTKLFFEKIQKYESLKRRSYRVCSVCDFRSTLPENSMDLKDAMEFKDLIVGSECGTTPPS